MRKGSQSDEDGNYQGLSAENKTQDEAGPVQRTGPTVSSLLLSAAGPAAVHCAFKQVRSQ